MAKKNKKHDLVQPEPVISKPPEVKVVLNEDDMPTLVLVCPRCKGDGKWHSTKTGVRALTSSEPLVDLTRNCVECNGTGHKS
jgi:hypothetical protein